MLQVAPVSRIVVGIDEEGRSDNAVRAALQLATRVGANLTIVHAVEAPLPRWRRADTVRVAAANAEALMKASESLRHHLATTFADVEHGDAPLDELLRVVPGRPADVILEQVSASPGSRELVFLGPHRSRGVLDFGSTARGVLARSVHPVWVQTGEPRDIRRVLVPLDLSTESVDTLREAHRLSQAIGAKLHVVHCFVHPAFAYPPPPESGVASVPYVVAGLRSAAEKELARLVHEFDWQDVEHSAALVDGDPVASILELQEEADLVVIGANARSTVAPVVLGSTAYGVLRGSEQAVMAVHHVAS